MRGSLLLPLLPLPLLLLTQLRAAMTHAVTLLPPPSQQLLPPLLPLSLSRAVLTTLQLRVL